MPMTGVIIYLVSPEYHFEIGSTVLWRHNKITGEIMGFTTGLKDGKQVMTRGWKDIK